MKAIRKVVKCDFCGAEKDNLGARPLPKNYFMVGKDVFCGCGKTEKKKK